MAKLKQKPVSAWTATLSLPTYLPEAPDVHPMFLEKRVYQGSSGKVYPLPFTDRIAEEPREVRWKAIWIENEYLRVLVLPQLGGRIHAILDKTNKYDLIYRQDVIKPALVGLAGPWISGGIEFNWPQHHRPATFMPVDYLIESGRDGSKTVWCSDHDPMERMKGMHGICLRPGKAFVELKVRSYNRTQFTKTFLWWANVATRVHEEYQSFFPPDVHFVADHARRAMTEYPLARGFYYGVNYGERARSGVSETEKPSGFVPAHCRRAFANRHPGSHSQDLDFRKESAPLPDYPPNDLSFYANIPTPCSYMCVGSREDFFGGYDYRHQAGLVHIANHHISPGKKQWTWGNHDFGYAWDRNLTEPDREGEYGPYIELMAGVYTDNQPDFSFLRPGETRTWSQYWYPIQKIGPAQHANLRAAVSLVINSREIRVGVSVSGPLPKSRICLEREGAAMEWRADLAPGRAFYKSIRQPKKAWAVGGTTLRVLAADGKEIIRYPREQSSEKARAPGAATEPPAPKDVPSTDELYIIGLHLEQYRHASRCPTLYWREALGRDSGDSRCNNALGLWHLRRGEFDVAEKHFAQAVERLTSRNANPADGEPYYNLGLCLRYLGRNDEAYAAFYKATWTQAWQAAGHHALAELDCCTGDWDNALQHVDHSLCYNMENTRARNLKAIILAKLGYAQEARKLVAETLAIDPLDWWARHLAGKTLTCDNQTALDIAHDYARAGLLTEAEELLAPRQTYIHREGRPVKSAAALLPDQNLGTAPLMAYTLGWLETLRGNHARALRFYRQAAKASPDYCFPARLEEITILRSAIKANPADARAPYYLGNLFYDRRRHQEAINLWQQSSRLDGTFAIAWRNLAIGYYNVLHDSSRARKACENAWKASPENARLLYERDQLWKRLGESPKRRLAELEANPALVNQRDDLSVELCALYNQTGQAHKALAVVTGRRFQPWEGGEGQALGQFVRARLALGRNALAEGEAAAASGQFRLALAPPLNLAEAKHLLANQSDIHYWVGVAYEALGKGRDARHHWRLAAEFRGDFQGMKVRSFSEMTYYSALAWRRLGQERKAEQLLRDLLACAQQLREQPAAIDYFATSLPTMLLFEDDLDARQRNHAKLLEAQARAGLGEIQAAILLLREVLREDPNEPTAADLLTELWRAGTARSRRSVRTGKAVPCRL